MVFTCSYLGCWENAICLFCRAVQRGVGAEPGGRCGCTYRKLSWWCLLAFVAVKIKCLSLNPSLSHNYLGDEGLFQLFQCLPKLKMLHSLKWVAPVFFLMGFVEYCLWKHSAHLGRALHSQEQEYSVLGSCTVLSALSPPPVLNRLTPLEAWVSSVPQSLCAHSPWRGQVLLCHLLVSETALSNFTEHFLFKFLIGRGSNPSSLEGNSSEGREVLGRSSLSGGVWIHLQWWLVFIWVFHLALPLQVLCTAPFCTIERNIYCSCLINWTVLKPRLSHLQSH